MRLNDENLDLTTRKGVIARLLRQRFEAGALEEQDYIHLRGRIEEAQTREALDAVRTEIEKR